jgi:hypothetical protein
MSEGYYVMVEYQEHDLFVYSLMPKVMMIFTKIIHRPIVSILEELLGSKVVQFCSFIFTSYIRAWYAIIFIILVQRQSVPIVFPHWQERPVRIWTLHTFGTSIRNGFSPILEYISKWLTINIACFTNHIASIDYFVSLSIKPSGVFND